MREEVLMAAQVIEVVIVIGVKGGNSYNGSRPEEAGVSVELRRAAQVGETNSEKNNTHEMAGITTRHP